MIAARIEPTFESWKEKARGLLSAGARPGEIVWKDSDEDSDLLPGMDAEIQVGGAAVARVPARFLELAKVVAYYRDSGKWDCLYRALFRISRGEKHLMEIGSDADVLALSVMEKSVRRDAHKMKAFVRFRKVEMPGEPDHYVAWYQPDNPIVRFVAPFFARRFTDMRWTILTPDESVHWDGKELFYTAGVSSSEAPQDDAIEELWRQYYKSIFNPARLKLKAMTKEMPIRFWKNLPESRLICGLTKEQTGRVSEMLKKISQTAAPFVPEKATLGGVRSAAAHCRGCSLYKEATQTVFGVGPEHARLLIVGEQPGDAEDLAGEPFVGPAGKILDRALVAAGIDRKKIYLTNAVKHFKFQRVGKRRLHQKPRDGEIAACQPWLQEEVKQVSPEAIVCLGGTAARSVFGKLTRIEASRGQWLRSSLSENTLVTYHPSAVLRAGDDEKSEALFRQLVADLSMAARYSSEA